MKKLRKWIVEYNRFSKGDRHAVIVLSVLILLTLGITIALPVIIPGPEFDYSKYKDKFELFEKQDKNEFQSKSLFQFNPNSVPSTQLDSLDIPENIKRNILRYRNAGGIFKAEKDLRKIYGMNDSLFQIIAQYAVYTDETTSKETYLVNNPVSDKSDSDFFDPNKADQNELIAFGFNPFQAKNAIAYRTRGGVFKVSADILKIYGVDSAFYNSIKNHIRIESIILTEPDGDEDVLLIELNEADSSDLVELPGIGPSFAGRIIKYRDRLGGFHSVKQLLEIYNFPAETYSKIEGQMFADTLKIRKLRVNFSDFKELIRHPYFNRQQVNLLLKYRDNHGPFQNLDEVKSCGVFEEPEFKKLLPYLTCR